MNRAGPLIRGSLWNVTGQFLPQLYSLVISVTAARTLGPELLGRQSFISFIELATIMLLTGGFPLALTRYVSEGLGRGDAGVVRGLVQWAWRTQSIVAISGAAGLAIVACLGAQPRWAWVFAGIAVAANVLHRVLGALLNGAQRWRSAWIASLTTGALAVAATVIVLLAGGGIGGMFAVEAVAGIASVIWTRRLAAGVSSELPPMEAAPVELRRRVWQYARVASFSVLLNVIVWRRSELFVLARYAGNQDLALYAVAFATSAALGLMFDAVANMVMPAVATWAGTGAHDVIRSAYSRVARLALVVALFTVALALVVGPATIRLLYGSRFAGAGVLFLIMVAPLPIVALGRIATALLHGLGQQRPLVAAGAAAAVVNVTLDLLLIPHFAATGAAVASAVSQIVACAPLVFVSRSVGVSYDVLRSARSALMAACATALGWIVISTFNRMGLLAVLSGGLATAVLFVGLGWILNIVPGEDRAWMRAMMADLDRDGSWRTRWRRLTAS